MLIFPGLDLLASFLVLCADCGAARPTETPLVSFPIQDLEGVVSETGVVLDTEVSTDRNGSIRVTTEEPVTVPLYELGELEIPDSAHGYLAYRASVKADDLDGVAYLEAVIPAESAEEVASFAAPSRVTRTSNWVRQEAPVFPPDGRAPDRLLLNLVVEGRGTVRIDQIRVLWVGYSR